MLDSGVVLLGEIRCWSLLGVEGLGFEIDRNAISLHWPINPVRALSIWISWCVCSKHKATLGFVTPGASYIVTYTTTTSFTTVRQQKKHTCKLTFSTNSHNDNPWLKACLAEQNRTDWNMKRGKLIEWKLFKVNQQELSGHSWPGVIFASASLHVI